MRGLWIEDGKLAFREDLAEPPSIEGESRVRVRCAGVCATDLALRRGYMGFRGVPGHEFVGEAIDGPLKGHRVVGEINAACGKCRACEAGADRHCPERSVLGILGRSGAFAERLALPTRNLLPVPENVPDELAVFVEPLAAALRLVEQLGDVRGRRAVVAGDGRLGLLCAYALDRGGAEVLVAGRHAGRQALLPPGVTHATGLFEEGAPSPSERDFELAVEASGNPAVLPRLIPWVRPQGTIVLKTTSERPVELDLAALVVDEIRLLGSRCGRFAPALEALASGDLDLTPLVHAEYPLEEGVAALERAAQPGTLKVLLNVC